MRLFVLTRHAESTANARHVLSSDPSRPVGLTSAGREQALRLGDQLAHLEIDLAVASTFPRTRETAELALRGRSIPLLIEPHLDEVRAGIFDGTPMDRYWQWRERHPRSERFPAGESLDEATRRYGTALRRLLARTEAVTLVVAHELAVRYVVEAAAGSEALGRSDLVVCNATPYLFDDRALLRAADRLDALAPPAWAEAAA